MSSLLRTCEACAAVLAYVSLAPEALDFELNSFKVHSQTSHKMRKLGGDKLKARTCPIRLFSETRQEHPADGGDLAIVPREHLVKWMWTTFGGRTTSAMVPPFQKTVGDLFC